MQSLDGACGGVRAARAAVVARAESHERALRLLAEEPALLDGMTAFREVGPGVSGAGPNRVEWG